MNRHTSSYDSFYMTNTRVITCATRSKQLINFSTVLWFDNEKYSTDVFIDIVN